MSSQTASFRLRGNGAAMLGFALCTLLGILLSLYTQAILSVAVALICLVSLAVLAKGRIQAWQSLLLGSLTLFIVLNYGFENFTPSVGGTHLLVGETLMFASLAIVALGPERRQLFSALREAPVVCMLVLLVLAVAHLTVDVPRYGVFAVRDSAKFIEASFLCLGFFWALQKQTIQTVIRWLLVLFLANLAYVCTFPWADRILAASPSFGIFHPVALFGQYQENAIYLLVGAIFFLWLAEFAVTWPRWVLVLLAIAQLCGLAVLQDRSMYAAAGVVLVLLVLIGQAKKMVQVASVLPWALGGLFTLVVLSSAFGVELKGRMGPVTPAFLEQHAATLFNLSDQSARTGADADRAGWYGDIWSRESSSSARLMFGEGFGQPLVDFQNEEGVPVREPHNSSLSVFARLGILGLGIWILFIVLVSARFLKAIRSRARVDDRTFRLTLFLFVYFVVALLNTSVQPTLEFSHGALPFFFLTGIALGVMRMQSDESTAGVLG